MNSRLQKAGPGFAVRFSMFAFFCAARFLPASLPVFFPASSAMAAGAPRIHVDQPVFDFGAVTDGKPVHNVFRIENKGDAPLVIERISVDCAKCLSHSLETNSISPGTNAALSVSINAEALEGRIEKALFLQSNDPGTPVYVLSLSGTVAPRCVQPAFRVSPGKLTLDPVDDEQVRIVFVRQDSAKPSVLTNVVAPSPEFRCEINPGPGRFDYRIYLRARNLSGKKGSIGGIVIQFDDPSRPEFPVPIEVR